VNIKKMLIPAVLMFAACGASADDPVGRYQLVAVTRTSTVGSSSNEFKEFFKIDTVTGRTWSLSEVLEKDHWVTEWVEVGGKQ
jgi:hypothetical protein